MFEIAKPLFLHCQTPLHVGSGDNLGIVDLPIQRERHTDFPKVESSSLKGSLREAFEELAVDDTQAQRKIHILFGYDEKGQMSEEIKKYFKEDTQFSGCLGFTDARLLLFPVKSLKGIFAWITCPYILNRLQEDLSLADMKLNFEIPKENTCTMESSLLIQDNQAVFEEYTYSLKPEEETTKLAEWIRENIFEGTGYWANKICTHLAVLGNDEFRDFVLFSTEVTTRIKIENETGTVQKGGLFTEEFLPAESVLYSLVLASPEFSKRERKAFPDSKTVIECFSRFLGENGIGNYFQLGGNSTLGKGMIRAILGD